MWNTGIEIKKDYSAAALRKLARQEKDGKVALRLLALANGVDGLDRESSARLSGMTRQTLRDWVHRYNKEGLDGLRDKPKGHAKRSLTPEQEEELKGIIVKGPDGTLVRWRCVDLQKVIKERFGVVYHERTVGKVLHRLGFSRVSVRPKHPEADSEAQEAFKKTS